MKAGWWIGELDLDDLLDDEVMVAAVKSAGLSRTELRRQLAEAAQRVAAARRRSEKSGYRAAFWELRAVR